MADVLATRRCTTCPWTGHAEQCPHCGQATVEYEVVLYPE